MKKRLPLLSILLFPIIICVMVWYFWFSPVTTIVLVRHAERLNDSDTTSLSSPGLARAQTLAHVLSVAGVRRIYISEKVRTEQTAAPTAALLALPSVQIPANESTRYVDSVKAHGGETILIVGHSDTIPILIEKLGITSPPAIGRTVFDDLFVVTKFRFRSTLTHLKYGNSSATM
jgi:broad specificity phosphatase PhoE